MSVWFYVSMYLVITIYVYIFLRRWAKYQKYYLEDIIIFVFAPILIWLYLLNAIKTRNKNRKGDKR